MIEQGEGGRIVTVASQAGKLGSPWLAAYCAAKFAAIGFTQSLAHELGEHGITARQASDAVLAASVFHFGTLSVARVKQECASRGFPMRWPLEED